MDQRIQIVLTIMNNNFRQNLSLTELANTVNLSPSRFHHIFKAETGVTPARHLHSLRLEKAKELLEVSLISVKQVMARVGITDRSHFDREFKKAYGLAPVKYRRAHYNRECADKAQHFQRSINGHKIVEEAI